MRYHARERTELTTHLAKRFSRFDEIGARAARFAVRRIVERDHAETGADERIDEAPELRAAAFPAMHEEHGRSRSKGMCGEIRADAERLAAVGDVLLP